MNNRLDYEYSSVVYYILNNEDFKKLKLIEHHGITRYEHSLKVSYYSYKIAKFLHLNYKEVARGGLLHDFFLSEEERDTKERFISTFTHPKKAVSKAKSYFDLTEKEIDMIRSHMFPINLSIPKYAESWLVNIVDKFVGMKEFCQKFYCQLAYFSNIYYLLCLNYLK